MTLRVLLLLCAANFAQAADWPTYRHDNRRSGVTEEALTFPLKVQWEYKAPTPPQTAWTAPARWDAYSGNDGLQSMRNFDPALFVTVQGDRVFFGSTVDHAAHCLDLKTGKENWVSFAEGPVRLPPTAAGEKVLFGSDDGAVYCVEAKTGEPIWRYVPEPVTRMIPNNGHLISKYPCRTGVMVADGKAYSAMSLLPWESSYLCALDLETGTDRGAGLYKTKTSGMTFQGSLLATADALIAPQGRTPPILFDLATGAKKGQAGGVGGVFCVLTPEDQLVGGPANQKPATSEIRFLGLSKNKMMMTLKGMTRILVDDRIAYVHQNKKLAAIDRIKFSELQQNKATAAKAWPESLQWEKPYPVPAEYILAGEVLVVGEKNNVAAFRAKDGTLLWEAEVAGKAYGLAVANGRLLVSTDLGRIICFGPP